jgi:type IX secretion system PorP/SprF family membrane protein
MKKLILLLLTISTWQAFAQQDAQASMYFFNPLQFNPAYAGSRGTLNVTAVSRAQWMGWEGAPRTQFLSVHAPVLRKRIGIGATIDYDKVGARSGLDAMFNFAYHMQLNSKDLKLSLGASAGIQQAGFNFTNLIATDYSDLNYQQSNSVVNTNFGFGAYLYSNKFYAGLSLPKLLDRSYASPTNGSFYQRHIYLTGGFVHRVNSVVLLKPSAMIKFTANAPVTMDFNFSAQFMNQLWIGALYRFHDAIGFNASYTINDFCMIGYAYDFPINGKLVNQWGSHEVVVSFDIRTKNSNKALFSPRYF